MRVNSLELENVIKDIAAGPFGSNLKVSCFVEYGFPIIDGANLKSFKVTDNITKFVTEDKARSLHRSIARRGDVVVTISGTLGQISYIPEDSLFEEYLVSQRQFRVTFDSERVYVPYIVFYFHTYEGQQKILSFANQVGVPALAQPLKNFKKIAINLPSLKNQKKIADIIEIINNKIEINERINKNLERQVSAIYKAWFEDFTPHGGTCPSDWEYTSLGEIAKIASGKRPSVKSSVKTDEMKIPLIGASSTMGFTNVSNNTNKILVIGRVGTHGVIQRCNFNCWASDNTLVISSKYYEYTSQILQRIDYAAMNRGSTQPLITQTDIKKVPILQPDEKTLQRFEDIAGSIMTKFDAHINENSKLSELRDTLLPKLMTGELDVSNIDI